jgi:hypothetical protein
VVLVVSRWRSCQTQHPLQAPCRRRVRDIPSGEGTQRQLGRGSICLRFLYRVRVLDTCRIAAVCLPYCGSHRVGYPHARNTLSESQGEA